MDSSNSPPSGTHTATVLYDFKSEGDNELSIYAGAKLKNIEFVRDDWWYGTDADGKFGYFPASYVKLDELPLESQIVTPGEEPEETGPETSSAFRYPKEDSTPASDQLKNLNTTKADSISTRRPRSARPSKQESSPPRVVKDAGLALIRPGFQSKDPGMSQRLQQSMALRDKQTQMIKAQSKRSGKDGGPVKSETPILAKTYYHEMRPIIKEIRSIERSLNLNGTSQFLDLEDELERFKVWADNIGASRRGPKGLEDRLKHAPHVSQCVMDVLNDLLAALKDFKLLVDQGNAFDLDMQEGEESEDDVESLSSLSLSSTGDDNVDFQPSQSSEFKVLFETIKACITDLFKLSIAIRKGSKKNEFTKSSNLPPLDATSDINYVMRKFPMAPGWLADRLGKALSRRRQHFLYLYDHHRKLAGKSDGDDARTQTEVTKATTFEDDGNLDLMNVEKTSEDGKSAVTFSTEAGDENVLKVPPAPKSAGEQPFECPYCYDTITIRDREAWKAHVFRDLQPYVCTFSACELTLFANRTEWFEHELEMHRRKRICMLCLAIIDATSSLTAHFRNKHPETLQDASEDELVRHCRRAFHPSSISNCPLCDERLSMSHSSLVQSSSLEDRIVRSLRRFRQHLGRHMEQLALFVLPKLDSDEGADGGSKGVSNASNASQEVIGSQIGADASGADVEKTDRPEEPPLD